MYLHSAPRCQKCGREMVYVHVRLPASRDDHKMWKMAEEKSTSRESRRRRPGRLRSGRKLALWERQLLKAAK